MPTSPTRPQFYNSYKSAVPLRMCNHEQILRDAVLVSSVRRRRKSLISLSASGKSPMRATENDCKSSRSFVNVAKAGRPSSFAYQQPKDLKELLNCTKRSQILDNFVVERSGKAFSVKKGFWERLLNMEYRSTFKVWSAAFNDYQ